MYVSPHSLHIINWTYPSYCAVAITEMEDVKPPRGFIPSQTDIPTSRAATHGYFKVSMHVEAGDDHYEEMVPIVVKKPQSTLCVQKFVAVPGRPFYCKIRLKQPPPDGVQYGARVYIDKGGLNDRHVYDLARSDGGIIRQQQPAERVQQQQQYAGRTENVDEADCDHFFWLGPRETSYDVRGFYYSGDEEYAFRFSELTKGGETWNGTREVFEKLENEIGVIRFQFSKVKRMKKRDDVGYKHRAPSPAKDYEGSNIYKKGTHISVRPGKRLKTGKATDMVAELEENIVYESRLYFNDVFGYKVKAHKTGDVKIYSEPSHFAAVPLSEFRAGGHRKFFLKRFLLWLQQKRFVHLQQSSRTNGGGALFSTEEHNSPVGTEDIVHAINITLSPAAAYILCTGRDEPDNYQFGEKFVQKMQTSVTREEREKFFEEKETGLISFFTSAPDDFELISNGEDRQGRRLYSVRETIVVIELSDSDTDD